MINVSNKVKVYEYKDGDGNSLDCSSSSHSLEIAVENHWNYNERVNLVIGKEVYTVLAKDLKAAIENATNVNRL